MSSEKRCLINMRDVHTCSIDGVDLVGAMIGFTSMKLPHLARQMLRCPRIHVPVGIDGVGLSVPLLLRWRRTISHGNLTRKVARVLAIIAETQKTLLKAFMTLRGPVPITTTKQTHTLTASPR